MKFKKGDKVICIIEGMDGKVPHKGKIYTVARDCVFDLVSLKGYKNYYSFERFKLATELNIALS